MPYKLPTELFSRESERATDGQRLQHPFMYKYSVKEKEIESCSLKFQEKKNQEKSPGNLLKSKVTVTLATTGDLANKTEMILFRPYLLDYIYIC